MAIFNKIAHFRLPQQRFNNHVRKSIVTSFCIIDVPKRHATSYKFSRYLSTFHAPNVKTILPGLSTSESYELTIKNTNYSCEQPFSKNVSRYYCSTNKEASEKSNDKPEQPSLLQRFKQMYRDYWYVLVPVHLVTSAIWFSSFYYLAKSGVDIASILETIGAGEKLVEKLKNSNSTMGYIAIAYALYKIATPVRYTITLGGTTISIKYLKDWGYIKPIPPKEKIKSMLNEQKEVILQKKEDLVDLYQKEKDCFTTDKKGFYRYFFPKIVRAQPKEKKKEQTEAEKRKK